MTKQKVMRAVWVGGILLFMVCSFCFGVMTITLRNGDVITIPVTRGEVQSISYEGEPNTTPDTTHGITWDFETGDLRGWTSTGEAFDNQPTYGYNPAGRDKNEPAHYQGNYWIGTYENRHRPSDPSGQTQGDGPQGTLTSQPFKITRPTISFLISGGSDLSTERVELLIDGRAVFRATGKCYETMERIKWNVSPYLGKQARFRLVDSASGKWGHINFDDVRFQ